MAPGTIWEKEQLEKEQVRALFVVGVTGIFAVVRLTRIGQTLTAEIGAKFKSFGVGNAIDVLIACWIGYLILMIPAVSDDLLNRALGQFGLRLAAAAKFFGYLCLAMGLISAFVVIVLVGYFRLVEIGP